MLFRGRTDREEGGVSYLYRLEVAGKGLSEDERKRRKILMFLLMVLMENSA